MKYPRAEPKSERPRAGQMIFPYQRHSKQGITKELEMFEQCIELGQRINLEKQYPRQNANRRDAQQRAGKGYRVEKQWDYLESISFEMIPRCLNVLLWWTSNSRRMSLRDSRPDVGLQPMISSLATDLYCLGLPSFV